MYKMFVKNYIFIMTSNIPSNTSPHDQVHMIP